MRVVNRGKIRSKINSSEIWWQSLWIWKFYIELRATLCNVRCKKKRKGVSSKRKFGWRVFCISSSASSEGELNEKWKYRPQTFVTIRVYRWKDWTAEGTITLEGRSGWNQRVFRISIRIRGTFFSSSSSSSSSVFPLFGRLTSRFTPLLNASSPLVSEIIPLEHGPSPCRGLNKTGMKNDGRRRWKKREMRLFREVLSWLSQISTIVLKKDVFWVWDLETNALNVLE